MRTIPTFLRSIVTKYTLALYALSLLMLLVASYVDNPASSVLQTSGSAILITTLVSSIINFNFERSLWDYFDVIRGATGSSLHRIYIDRSSAISNITESIIREYREIYLLSISGTSFFQPTCDILKEIVIKCERDANVNVKILLLDPRSKHAIDRAIIEQAFNLNMQNIDKFDYPSSKLCEDILLAIRQVEIIMRLARNNQVKSFRIQARLYDTAPIMLLSGAGDRVYVEQYHYGSSEEERRIGFVQCIGQKVPILEFAGGSRPARLYMSHFQYLWSTSSRRNVADGTSDLLRTQLATGRWKVDYQALRDLEEPLGLEEGDLRPLGDE